MKIYHMLAVATFVALAGCCQLSDQDRALLNDTKAMAQDAKTEATQAATAAQAAQQSAAQSAAAAQAASQKADRIFRQSGVK
jgi:hypothetical protein